MTSHGMPPEHFTAPMRGHRSWHLVYFALAGFDVLTVCASLILNDRIITQFSESVDANNVWAHSVSQVHELQSLAGACNAPGNEIFEHKDADRGHHDLTGAMAAFGAHLDRVKGELVELHHGTDGLDYSVQLDAIRGSADAMAAEAEGIFARFRLGKLEEAGELMSRMDGKYYELGSQISELAASVKELQLDTLERQRLEAIRWGRYEYVLGGSIVFLVIGVTAYGIRIHRTIQAYQNQLERHSRSLEASNLEIDASREELEAQHQELVRINAHLEEAQRLATEASAAKSAFLANMSHEIRTPMTAILGFADLLAESEDNSTVPQRQDAVQTIRRSGEHLLGIINDILDLSKIESGKMTVETVPVQLGSLLCEINTLLRFRAAAKGVTFTIEQCGPLPRTIRTDPTRLKQILINVLGNSIKFTELGGVRLVVELENDGNPILCFDVIDTGIGMTTEQAERVFTPFSQADESTTRRFGGTGLGLSISKRLAALLGGDLVFVRSDPGIGTHFRLTVTAGSIDPTALVPGIMAADKNSTHASTNPLQEGSTSGGLAGVKILLAEDGPDNQRLITLFLKKTGASVRCVENGRKAVDEALEASRRGKTFDVILMDMQMPVMDGYSATTLLRAEGYRGRIIALTAHAMSTDRQKCLDAGCDDYATKPIDRVKLLSTISNLLRVPVETSA